ncbi:MAG: glycosyltransferase [Chthoniobacter sp.]|uniref:glycosyltransferase n=1 Tax=Chthoniobacter sp. TaxID=2510640 RepID=UPI0032A7CDA3
MAWLVETERADTAYLESGAPCRLNFTILCFPKTKPAPKHSPPAMPAEALELLVVLPVFNEQASVRKVVMEWFQEILNWTEGFVFVAIDDGSTDETPRVLARLREQLGLRFEIIQQANRGHGQTCLRGYRLAAERGIPSVFQIDSDGQCDPQYFFRFWRLRKEVDVIYGRRWRRDDGWRRSFASYVLKIVLLCTTGAWCEDANVPYRLMRTDAISAALAIIPADFYLANVALAVILKKKTGARHATIPIRFRERYGGEPCVVLAQFGNKAWELVRQLRSLPPIT